MSDYSEVWGEMHKDQFERERKIAEVRERMKKELSTEDMIKVMFSHFIDMQPGIAVLHLGEQYLPKKEKVVEKTEPKVKEVCGINGLDCIKCSMGPCDNRKTINVN